MHPGQKEIHRVLAFLAEATHKLIPPEDLEPITKHLIDNFVNDRCTELAMTMGLNTLREMCNKNPLIMDHDKLSYLSTYN